MINKLTKVAKNNLVSSLFALFVVVPLFVYGLAVVAQHDGDRHRPLSHYVLGFLAEPLLALLFVLLIVNAVVDFWVIRDNKKAVVKCWLSVLNIGYMLVWVIRLIPKERELVDFIFFILPLAFLCYKTISYYRYYQWFIK